MRAVFFDAAVDSDQEPLYYSGLASQGRWSQAVSGYSLVPLDTCRRFEEHPYDAGVLDEYGEIEVTGPRGSIIVGGSGPWRGTGDADGFVEPAATYALSGSGTGNVDAFEVEVSAPDDLVVTNPVLRDDCPRCDCPGCLGLEPEQDLELEWNPSPSPDGDVILIADHSAYPGDRSSWVSICRFTDDGFAVVPFEATEYWITIKRERTQLVDIAGFEAPMGIAFGSLWSFTNDDPTTLCQAPSF